MQPVFRMTLFCIVVIGLMLLFGTACRDAAPAPAQPEAPVQQPLARENNPPGKELPPRAEDVPLEPPPDAAPGARDLVGIWTSEEMTQYGMVYAETILERNNNYSHQVRWNDLMTYEVGVYEVGDGFIHFNVQDYQPKVYKGTELSRPLSWTVFYSVVDDNTMFWEDRILNTRWQVHRREW